MDGSSEYVRTGLKGFLSVSSIVSVWRLDMGGRVCEGEAHDFPELLYVDSGSHSIRIDGSPFFLEPGQLIVYAPGAHHIGHLPSNAAVSIIGFEAELSPFGEIFNTPLTLSESQQRALGEIVSLGSGMFCPAPRELGVRGMIPCEGVADYAFQRLKNRLELFLIDIYCSCNGQDGDDLGTNSDNFQNEELARVQSYMLKNLSRELSLSTIASDCSMSLSGLKLLFREQCGCGPIGWFIDQKLSAAKTMIRETSLSFTQISERLGFGSVHYFSRLFKSRTGMTPTEYAHHARRGRG